jgi:hypothetical protein
LVVAVSVCRRFDCRLRACMTYWRQATHFCRDQTPSRCASTHWTRGILQYIYLMIVDILYWGKLPSSMTASDRMMLYFHGRQRSKFTSWTKAVYRKSTVETPEVYIHTMNTRQCYEPKDIILTYLFALSLFSIELCHSNTQRARTFKTRRRTQCVQPVVNFTCHIND